MNPANDPLAKIPVKPTQAIRLVTFNINGSRTLFNYYPWNQLKTYSRLFNSLKSDIVTLQELKLNRNDINSSIGNISDYKSYITLPKSKKSYSGVGVFVRIPREDESERTRQALTVVKAEEGVTGCLKSPDYNTPYRELPSDSSIGGYPVLTSDEAKLNIDDEGRCIIIELNFGIVIISLYCPANSMNDARNELFRLTFVAKVLERVENLKKLGKEVIVLGDINISPDLIDNAESMSELKKLNQLNIVKDNDVVKEGEKFEELNLSHVAEFKNSKPHRTLLNKYLFDPSLNSKGLLYDVTRYKQGKRMRMYTVWNTMKNSRPGNYGSRIDLILATSFFTDYMVESDIWPFLMGSDHCPVYADFKTDYAVDFIKKKGAFLSSEPKLKFEAKHFYKLINRDISSMFKRSSSSLDSHTAPSVECEPKEMSHKRSKKPIAKTKKGSQLGITNFFFSDLPPKGEVSPSLPRKSLKTETEEQSKSIKLDSIDSINSIFGPPPKCRHNEPATLKTSKSTQSKGKKFWCCKRDIGDYQHNNEFRCDFFKWVQD